MLFVATQRPPHAIKLIIRLKKIRSMVDIFLSVND